MGARLTDEQLGTCEFAAPTPWGQVHLALPFFTNKVPDVLVHAMSLGHGEALIIALENWCGQALSWQPVPAGLGRGASHVAASVCDPKLAPLGSNLRLPVAMLQHQCLPTALQAPFLSWPQWSYEATLAELADELVRAAPIMPGDMLLLPDAFLNDWPVTLQPDQAGTPLQGLLNLDEARIDGALPMPASHADAKAESKADWRVVLSQPVRLDMGMALGWHEADVSLPLDGAQDQDGHTDFGLHAQLRHRERGIVLSGMVVPVLLGAALWVRTRHQAI